MTIINSFVQGKRAYLLTDMAWVDKATGSVLACDSKFIRGTNFPWVMAVTGDAHLPHLLVQISYLQPGSAKEMVESLPAALRAVQAISLDPTFTMAIRLAAWCWHTGRARIFHLDMDEARCARFGIEPWEVIEAHVLVPGEGIADTLPDIDFTPEAIMDRGRFDPRRDGVRVVAAQREHIRFPLKGRSEPMALIGGGVQLASVNRRGVRIETLHRWLEDRIGERIAPGAMSPALDRAEPDERTI